MESDIEKCLMNKGQNKEMDKKLKMKLKKFDEKRTGVLSNATKKWGDPLQRPHRTGDWAFSSEQINCTCQANM